MNMRMKNRASKLIIYILLIGGSLVFMIPFVWMLSTSLKESQDLFALPPIWIPERLIWQNYIDAVTTFPFVRYTLNTAFITVMNVIGGVLSSSLIAYAFAKLQWPGKNIWFMLLISTMMLPGQVTMIPLFILYRELGWINTHLPLIVPAFFGSAFYIFLIRQFFMTIPKDLSEAAKIDGSSELGIYWHIYMPLSKPVLATVAIFIFLFAWNDFIGPLIYLHESDLWTLSLGLRGFQQQFGTRWNVMMAASIIAMLPNIFLFFGFQKHFIQGVAVGGIKG